MDKGPQGNNYISCSIVLDKKQSVITIPFLPARSIIVPISRQLILLQRKAYPKAYQSFAFVSGSAIAFPKVRKWIVAQETLACYLRLLQKLAFPRFGRKITRSIHCLLALATAFSISCYSVPIHNTYLANISSAHSLATCLSCAKVSIFVDSLGAIPSSIPDENRLNLVLPFLPAPLSSPFGLTI